jgi:hypothetical protein
MFLRLKMLLKKIGIPFIMKTSTEINIPPGPKNRYFVFKEKPTQEFFLVAFKILEKYGSVILILCIYSILKKLKFVDTKTLIDILQFFHCDWKA